MKVVKALLALSALFSVLGSAQTGGILSPGPTLPTDAAGVTPLSPDLFALISRNGDLMVADSKGAIKSLLMGSELTDGVLYRASSTAVLSGTEIASLPAYHNGVLYFVSLCKDTPRFDACAMYKWDQKSLPVKLFTAGEEVLTNLGFFPLRFISGPSPAPDGSVVFSARAGNIVRRTETPTGAVYRVEYSALSSQGILTPAVGPDGTVYFSVYPAVANPSSRLFSMKNGPPGTDTGIPVLPNGFWIPVTDPSGKVIVNSLYNVGDRHRRNIAYEISLNAVEKIQDDTFAGPVVSNGLRFYMALNTPWDGRTFVRIWDSLLLRDEASKTWNKALSVGDTLPDGKKITGIKQAVPFAQHAFVLLNEGWYRLTPVFGPPPPPPLPTATVTVDRPFLNPGESSTLRWTTSGATEVSIDQGIGVVPASGNRAITPAFTATYSLTARNASGTTTARVTVNVSVPKPPVVIEGIGPLYASGTPRSTTGFAPDSGISIYGSGLAAGLPPYPFGTAREFPLPERLNGARVLVDGQPLRLYHSFGSQINAVLPPNITPGTHKLIVQRWDANFSQFEAESQPVDILVVRIAPAFVVFTPQGATQEWPAVQLLDGSFATPENPVPFGQTVTLYLTGLGAKETPRAYGELRSEPTRSQTEIHLMFRISDQPVEGKIAYAGTTLYPGLEQINVQIPDAVSMGMNGVPETTLYIDVMVDGNVVQTFTLKAVNPAFQRDMP